MLPQLDFSTYPTQIFWVVLVFSVLCAVLYKVLPRIIGVLEKEEACRDSTIAHAGECRKRAEGLNRKYDLAYSDIEKNSRIWLDEQMNFARNAHRKSMDELRDASRSAVIKNSANIIRKSDALLSDFLNDTNFAGVEDNANS